MNKKIDYILYIKAVFVCTEKREKSLKREKRKVTLLPKSDSTIFYHICILYKYKSYITCKTLHHHG